MLAAVSVACCQWPSEPGFRRRCIADGRTVAGGRNRCRGRCVRPRRSVPIVEVARATSTRRAVAGTVQLRLKIALTGEDYVKRKAWLDATAPPCPWHTKDCQLVPHGTYERRTPEGARVRRFRCRRLGRTVSLLPDCLAARLPGTLEDVEATVRGAEQAPSLATAAIEARPEDVDTGAAQRWTSRRWRPVQQCLELLRTLYPQRFGAVEAIAFGAALGTAAVLAHLRAVAAKRPQTLPAPVGFHPARKKAVDRSTRKLQHKTGLSPPADSVKVGDERHSAAPDRKETP